MGSDKYILNENGDPEPCDSLQKWGEWMQGADRRVASDIVNGARVSTVFLGLDHSFGGTTPLLFETMIFDGPHDQYQERYATRDEALAGHKKAVALASLKAGAP